ncbi:MAG TPA: hypothetical protein DCF68_19705 [Cyanothece sp. UBA12306]|nr:hypothetical protein [Cyanothece sp. UBA12306]
MKIGYLIPEFPSQTHIWMWREICHLREWGCQLQIFSTKQPPSAIQARHAFAKSAQEETCYLWPQSVYYLLTTLLWVLFTRPLGLIKSISLAFTLNVNQRPKWRYTLPLVIPACILARQALKQNIEHLHSHSCANSAILAMMLKRLTGIPYSLTLNANIEWWGGAMEEKMADAQFTIAITQWLLNQIKQDYPHLKPEQAILGRIGVDTIKWKPENKSIKKEGEVFQIITVGRLHASKGHDVLIRAIKRLINANHLVQLTIVGAGDETESLQSLVNELDLSGVVKFTGSLSEDEIIELMKQSDAFVLASHAEPLGVVYMEAMAMGVPTIGTNAGGVPEIILPGEDGLLVPPNDEITLAKEIEKLLNNPDEQQKLGHNGRQKIVNKFDSRFGAATLYQRFFGNLPQNFQPNNN